MTKYLKKDKYNNIFDYKILLKILFHFWINVFVYTYLQTKITLN